MDVPENGEPETEPDASGSASTKQPLISYLPPSTPPYEGSAEGALDLDSAGPPRSELPWTASGIPGAPAERARPGFGAWLLRIASVAGVVGVLAALFYGPLRGDPPAPAPPPAAVLHGTLSVQTEPNGVRVELDGRDVGVSPVVIDDLRTGGYRVRLTQEGYEPIEMRTEVRANQETAVTRELYPTDPADRGTGELDLQTDPVAEVFWQGESLGHTPLTRVELPAGVVPLELVTAEGERHHRGVLIARDDRTSTHMDLTAIVPPVDRRPSR